MSDTQELLFPVAPELVDLPSKGKFYSSDHPLYQQECVEIYQMRGQEEDILTNMDYMRKGLTIDKLLNNLIVNPQLKKPEYYNKILAADRNAMLIQTRITAYTWEYPVVLKCASCGKEQEFEFDLRKQQIDSGYSDSDKQLFPNICYLEDTNCFHLTFPDTSVYVVVRPRTIEIENKIAKKLLNKKNKDLLNKDLYEDMIVEIKGSSDPNLIKQFFEQIPAKHLSWFKAALLICNPDISLSQEFICSACNHSQLIEPPITTDFLFPKIKGMKKKFVSQENSE